MIRGDLCNATRSFSRLKCCNAMIGPSQVDLVQTPDIKIVLFELKTAGCKNTIKICETTATNSSHLYVYPRIH